MNSNNNKLPTRARITDKEREKLIKAYNAGIIGGKASTMINFLEMFTDIISKCPSNINSNMGALNYILNTQKFRLLSGFPLHNRFRSFKHEDAYIQHK